MGKSTLLMQALGSIAARGARCLLVCAEESTAQVRMRADRLGALAPELFVVSETSLPAVVASVATLEPVVLAIDSIQAVHDPDAPGAAGSVTQVRDGAQELVRIAKENDIATLLVGHVTKDGGLAGPRALEHVVDTVLSFEGDRHHALRMLRALKHRFGATDELGLMEMTATGLLPVIRPERALPRRSPSGRNRLGGHRGHGRHAATVCRGAGARRADGCADPAADRAGLRRSVNPRPRKRSRPASEQLWPDRGDAKPHKTRDIRPSPVARARGATADPLGRSHWLGPEIGLDLRHAGRCRALETPRRLKADFHGG